MQKYEVAARRMDDGEIAHHRDRDVLRDEVGPYPYLIGATAALGSIVFYLGFITLTSDWENARMQFSQYRWWILALAAGLGVQAALFSFLRRRLQGRRTLKAAKSGLAASGGASAASMAACCAHYLVPILPLLGLSFLSPVATSLPEYQKVFFFAGVISNLAGIGIMLHLMRKNGILSIRTVVKNLKHCGLSWS